MIARLLWDSAFDGSVVVAEARPLAASGDAFDISRVAAAVAVAVDCDGREMAVLSDGLHRIRLDIAHGSLLLGPVRLRYLVDDDQNIDAQLQVLRRLTALRRNGRFPHSLFSSETMAPRWVAALRTCDAMAAGAGQRDIAAMLFGTAAAHGEWRGESDFLRFRVQRLVRAARRMIDRGYLSLLR